MTTEPVMQYSTRTPGNSTNGLKYSWSVWHPLYSNHSMVFPGLEVRFRLRPLRTAEEIVEELEHYFNMHFFDDQVIVDRPFDFIKGVRERLEGRF